MSDNINFKLYWAAWHGKYDEVAGYISRGADPAWTYRSDSALHIAAENGRVQVVGLLLDHGWDKEARNDWGRRPLHLAAEEKGHVEVIQLLAERGAEINCQDSFKQDTPLHHAADNGRTAVVQLLLSLGADPTIKNENGSRPLHLAAAGGHVEVIQLLAEWQKQPRFASRLPLQHNAALHGVVRMETEFLDSQDNNGDTPLHLASKRGLDRNHRIAAEALIQLGADTTIKNGEGKTAKEAYGEKVEYSDLFSTDESSDDDIDDNDY